MIAKPLHFSQSFQENSRIKTNPFLKSNLHQPRILFKVSNSCVSLSEGRLLVDEFNPKIPVEKAVTPPSSWYTHSSFLQLELDRVFYKGWQAVGMNDLCIINSFRGRLETVFRIKCWISNDWI